MSIPFLALIVRVQSTSKPKSGGADEYAQSKDLYEELLKQLQPPPRPAVDLTPQVNWMMS